VQVQIACIYSLFRIIGDIKKMGRAVPRSPLVFQHLINSPYWDYMKWQVKLLMYVF
jgi:hypothetical protein